MVRNIVINWLWSVIVHAYTVPFLLQHTFCSALTVPTCYLPVPLAAVQNERQPRSTAHVSLDSISMDTKTDHLATTQELTSSAAYSSVICRPLVTSSVTSSATIRPSSNPSNNHRFMVSLLTAETCAKLEPEDGELFKWLKHLLVQFCLQVFTSDTHKMKTALTVWQSELKCIYSKYFTPRSLKLWLTLFLSGREYWCDNQWFSKGSDFLWLSYITIHLQLFTEYIWDIGTAPLHVCQVGKKFACFCSLAISRPGEPDRHLLLYWNVLHILEAWLRLIICISVVSSGDSPRRSMEWDVPPVCHPVVPAHGQLSSSVSSRSFPHTSIQDQPPHSWPAHPWRGFSSLQGPGCWPYWVCLPEGHCTV